jgi:hypothetical protein
VRWSFIKGMNATLVHNNIYLEFLDHLNAVDVRYAVLHGWESLARGEVSDVDIIVAAQDLGKLEASLCERYRVLNLFHYEASSFGFVLSPKDLDSGSLFVADLSSDYRWRGRIFFTAEELLRARRNWSGFWVAGPAQEFAYLLVKKIYEKGAIPEHQRIRLEQLAEELHSTAHSVASRLFGTIWGNRLIGWIIQKRWNQIVANITPLQRKLQWQVLKDDYLNPLRYWFAEARRIWLRWRYPTGLTVAVLGPDGPEKSTVIKDLPVALASVFRHTAILKRFPTWASRSATQSCESAVPARARIRKQLTWMEFVRELLAHGLPFLIRVRPLLLRSTLVMFEHCCDDLLITENLEATRFAHRIMPRPDLSFIIGSNDRLSSETSAHKVRDVVAEYLNIRYSERRHVWFHCCDYEALRRQQNYREVTEI